MKNLARQPTTEQHTTDEGYAQFVDQLAAPPNTFTRSGVAYHLLMDTMDALNPVMLELDHLKRVITYGDKLRMNPPSTMIRPPLQAKEHHLHMNGDAADLLHGLLGIMTEALELAPIIAGIIQGTENSIGSLEALQDKGYIDLTNVEEELGDHMFYSTLAGSALRRSSKDVRTTNVNKLLKRYESGKFDADAALNRNLDAERTQLEKDTKANSDTDKE